MRGDKVFVDTNVILYSFDPRDRARSEAANNWIEALWSTGRGRLSWQVLHEFYVNATRKAGMPAADAREAFCLLAGWNPVDSTIQIVRGAWQAMDTANVTYWDALILAAAAQLECRWLLSEDFQHDRIYGSVRVVNPFRITPQELLGM